MSRDGDAVSDAPLDLGQEFFAGASHQEALARLEYVVETGLRCSVVVGPKGAGKSFALRTFVAQPSTGNSNRSGHSHEPGTSKSQSFVHCLRFGDPKSAYAFLSRYNAMIHCRLGECQKTLGSRFWPMTFFKTGFCAYLVHVRPRSLL